MARVRWRYFLVNRLFACFDRLPINRLRARDAGRRESPTRALPHSIAMISVFLGVIAVAAASSCVSAQAVPISIPLTAPATAVMLNPALLSFSIEQDRWPDWAGASSPNKFFQNALQNLAQRTGETPWIRIGADSEDHTNFNSKLQVTSLF